MAERIETTRAATGDFVEFWVTGQSVKGEFHCSECGYGVTIVRALPPCPMCGGTAWEQSAWSPFKRAAQKRPL
jgi:rubrerythrin